MKNNFDKLISRLDDLLYQSKKYNKSISSNFLSEEEIIVAKKYLKNKCEFITDGGYKNSEYSKVIINPDGTNDIVCLKSYFDKKYYSISHRDILGSIMGLSINRNQVGDFWVEDNIIYIYTSLDFSKFLINNLTKIGRCTINLEISETKVERVLKTQKIEKIVSSLRIDNIISSILNCSRSDAQDIIKNQRIKINHILILENSKNLNENDIISIKGSGRYKFTNIINYTKKDKIVILIEKYI